MEVTINKEEKELLTALIQRRHDDLCQQLTESGNGHRSQLKRQEDALESLLRKIEAADLVDVA